MDNVDYCYSLQYFSVYSKSGEHFITILCAVLSQFTGVIEHADMPVYLFSHELSMN